MELISNVIVPWAISAARPLYSLYCRLDMFLLLLGLVHLYFRISQSVFASYEPPDAILSFLFYVLGF